MFSQNKMGCLDKLLNAFLNRFRVTPIDRLFFGIEGRRKTSVSGKNKSSRNKKTGDRPAVCPTLL
jgi:hypothetical protein